MTGQAESGKIYQKKLCRFMYRAIAAIFVLLVYYHAAGKLHRGADRRMCEGWEEIYGKNL